MGVVEEPVGGVTAADLPGGVGGGVEDGQGQVGEDGGGDAAVELVADGGAVEAGHLHGQKGGQTAHRVWRGWCVTWM